MAQGHEGYDEDGALELAAEQKFRELASHLPDYVCIIDRQRRYRWVNRIAAGLTMEMVEGARIDDFADSEQMPAAIEAVERCFATGEHTEYTISGYGDGNTSWHYETRVVPAAPFEGAARALLLTRNITEQVVAANDLRASEQRLDRAIAAGRIGLWEFDFDSQEGSLTADMAQILGWPENGITSQMLREATHPEDRSHFDQFLDEVSSGTTERYERESRIRAADGSYRAFADRGARITLPDGRAVLAGTMVDVTELRELESRRRELQEQLEQAQRLESIGLLAGGVAHDFNNLLTVIISGTQLAQRASNSGRDASSELEQVLHASNRAAQLTQQLLAFGRRSSLTIDAFDMAEVASQVVEMSRRLIPRSIHIAFEPPPKGAMVHGDRQQLEQALLNLCINARDAMEHGGQLSVLITVDDANVVVTVRDTGSGIADGDLPRVFEPFFTTKPPGSGTGLGLAMVHGIVHQHKGSIAVESEQGVGTEFHIRLPRSEGAVVAARARSERMVRGEGRILVAEDESMILDLTRRILVGGGYQVETARDGQEAVEKFEAENGAFDLVLLDAVMPRLGGLQAYRRINTLGPSVPVLFCSGYTSSVIPDGFDPSTGPAFLSKPYTPATLLQAVSRAINKDHSPSVDPG